MVHALDGNVPDGSKQGPDSKLVLARSILQVLVHNIEQVRDSRLVLVLVRSS